MLKIKDISPKRRQQNFVMLAAITAVIALFVISIANIAKNNNTANATLVGFNTGSIIDDATMANVNSMSVNDIQNFLSSKNSCNKPVSSASVTATSSTSAYYNANSNLTYSTKNGYFLCLANATFDSNGMPTDGSGTSAAQIIYNAAHKFNINPQVLIVLLQKEQGLITDDWPNSVQYQNATGYGCPDTAPCSTSNRGLVSQLEGAAYLFRTVLDGGWSNYPAYQTSYIKYSPSDSCGGSNVYIQNRATSALYRYTPYQPNSAALAADWGTASCGAYGNRNFYNYFTEWFGSTQSDVFTPQPGDINLADGLYIIKATNNRSLDILGGGTDNNTEAVSYTANGSSSQIWQLTHLANGYYTMKNVNSGKYLDVLGGGVYNGSTVGLYDQSSSLTQQFAITRNRYGGYNIQAVISGKTLDISGNSLTDNTPVTTISINNTAAQAWNFYPASQLKPGIYHIINAGSGKSLDATGGMIYANGTRIQLWDSNITNSAQSWKIVVDDNKIYIANCLSGKSLNIMDGQVHSQSQPIQLWDYSLGANNESWYAVAANNGGYTFLNTTSGKALDTAYGTIYNSGSLIDIYTQTGDLSQSWKMSAI